MKLLLPKLTILGCSLFSIVSVAFAQTSRFYVTGDLGGTLTQNANFNAGFEFERDGFPPLPITGTVKFDPGFRLGLVGGYHLTDWLGLEAVSGFMGSKINTISPVGGYTITPSVRDTFLSNIPLMGGLRLEWPHHPRFAPYIGASVGGTLSVLDPENSNFAITSRGLQSAFVFAYQVFGGVRYAFNSRASIDLEYHYFGSRVTEWRVDPGFYGFSDRFRISELSVNSLSLAFQYNF